MSTDYYYFGIIKINFYIEIFITSIQFKVNVLSGIESHVTTHKEDFPNFLWHIEYAF